MAAIGAIRTTSAIRAVGVTTDIGAVGKIETSRVPFALPTILLRAINPRAAVRSIGTAP